MKRERMCRPVFTISEYGVVGCLKCLSFARNINDSVTVTLRPLTP